MPIIEMFYTVQSQGLNIEFQSLMEANSIQSIRVNLKMINYPQKESKLYIHMYILKLSRIYEPYIMYCELSIIFLFANKL